jgi:DNA uptake protein ComE-like DNA-binding protein
MTTRSHRCVSILAVALLAGLAGCTQDQNAEEVKERWNRDKRLDLNTATKEQLMVLPGMTTAEADKVIAGRPYENAGELVMRGILPKNEYDKIADRVTARTWRAGACSAEQGGDCTTPDAARATESSV